MEIKLFGLNIRILYGQACTKYIENGIMKIKISNSVTKEAKKYITKYVSKKIKGNKIIAVKKLFSFIQMYYNNLYYYDKDYVKDLTISLKDAAAFVKKWGYR